MRRISIGCVAEVCRSGILGLLLPYRWQSLYVWTISVMLNCSFGQYKVRLTRWSVKVRPWSASCRRLGAPYLKELQLCPPSWQVLRGLSIHLGGTNIDPDPLVSLACYLANQWWWDLLAQPKLCLLSSLLVRIWVVLALLSGLVQCRCLDQESLWQLSSLMGRQSVSTTSTLLDRTNFTLLSYLEREATTFCADKLIADEAESPHRNRERISLLF